MRGRFPSKRTEVGGLRASVSDYRACSLLRMLVWAVADAVTFSRVRFRCVKPTKRRIFMRNSGGTAVMSSRLSDYSGVGRFFDGAALFRNYTERIISENERDP